MSDPPTFAQLLNHYLEKHGRNASWLARKIEVDPATVSRWANGETKPRDDAVIQRIVTTFKIRDHTEIEALATAAGRGFIYPASSARPDAPDAEMAAAAVQPAPLLDSLHTFLLRIANAAPSPLAASLVERFHLYNLKLATSAVQLYPAAAGDKGIDLAHRRLFISNAFGSYFAGLLERDNIYVEIAGQVDSPIIFGQHELAPLSRILWALQHPQGPRVVVIAAEAGMGKSTLAAKVVRALVEEQMIDLILGDSAKSERVNPVTGEIVHIDPAYYDWQSCCAKLYTQLGLPTQPEYLTARLAVQVIRNRLLPRRAVIVVDNLESVDKGSMLLGFLRALTSRDVRIVVTTRTVQEIYDFAYKTMVVNLRPITTTDDCLIFLLWHIEHFQAEYAELRRLALESVDQARIAELLERTGGIPLLLQLVISTIARSSWDYLDGLPTLFGRELLNFLYQERWRELGRAGRAGLVAQSLLHFVVQRQYQGEVVTLRMLAEWAAQNQQEDELQPALRLLHARFLIVNQDVTRGNFTVFPSLAEFLESLRADAEGQT